MTRFLPRVAGLVLAAGLLAGCGGAGDGGGGTEPSGAPVGGGGSFGWFGLPSVVRLVIETVHEGTGWVLDKSQVAVVMLGDVRPDEEGQGFCADFRITVTHGPNSFETTAKDVPCDADGIPTEESVATLRESIEDIKAKIKRLQN